MYTAVFCIHTCAANAHKDSAFLLKAAPKCMHLQTQRWAGMSICFFTISASLIKDITYKPWLAYIDADTALQRGEMKHPDGIYTTILLHNIILFRLAGEYTVPAAKCTSASNHLTSAFVTLQVQSTMKAKQPSPRIFTLL